MCGIERLSFGDATIEQFEMEQELKACIEDYISQFNTVRPHMVLGYETPAAMFVASFSVCA